MSISTGKTMAIISLIAGVLGLCGIGGCGAIMGLPLGFVSAGSGIFALLYLKKDQDQDTSSERSMAIIGLALGGLEVFVSILIILLVIVFLGLSFFSGNIAR